MAGPALAAHGGGYIVIMTPGYSGMTPRKDQICVAESLNVGRSFKNPNGDLLTVKNLSGKSAMCKKPATPILAEVEFIASATWQSTLSIELPEGYKQLDLTEKERFDGTRLRAVNKSKDVYIYVQSWDRRRTVQLFDLYVDAEKRDWATRGVKTKQTDTEKLVIHGAKAQRWETEIPGSGFLAPSYTHVTTDLLGRSEVVYIDVMTLTRRNLRHCARRSRKSAKASPAWSMKTGGRCGNAAAGCTGRGRGARGYELGIATEQYHAPVPRTAGEHGVAQPFKARLFGPPAALLRARTDVEGRAPRCARRIVPMNQCDRTAGAKDPTGLQQQAQRLLDVQDVEQQREAR